MAKEKSKKKPKLNYNISGGKIERKNRSCPKCGPGVFMANHSNRLTCSKCGYMEKKDK